MRRMVGADQDVYRVVVVRKKQVKNPDYVPGFRHATYWMYLDETYEEYMGPYNKVGTAKSILTGHTLDGMGQPYPWFVSGRIEKAATTWTTVEL
jgi:hypothetical protein